MAPFPIVALLIYTVLETNAQQQWNFNQEPQFHHQANFQRPQQISQAHLVRTTTFQIQSQHKNFPQNNYQRQEFTRITRPQGQRSETEHIIKKPQATPNFRRDLPPPPPAQFLPNKAVQTIRRPHQLRKSFLIQNTITQRPRNRVISLKFNESTPFDQISTLPSTTIQTTTDFPTIIPAREKQIPSHLTNTTIVITSKKDPNKYFLDCCKKKKVDPKCESRCNFDVLSKKVLTGMFIGSDLCPNHYGIDLFSCAAQDSDHTPCCITKNVQKTSAKEKCLAFCNLEKDNRFQADASYLPCWGVLNKIKECFKEAIINED